MNKYNLTKLALIFYLVSKAYSNGRPTLESVHQSVLALRDALDFRSIRRLFIPKIDSALNKLASDDVLPLI